MSQTSAIAEIDAVRSELKIAADTIIEATLASMEILADLRDYYPKIVPEAEIQLCKILEAASFQDIAGQRLANARALINGDAPPSDANIVRLENGPAPVGQGLSQADADALMNGAL